MSANQAMEEPVITAAAAPVGTVRPISGPAPIRRGRSPPQSPAPGFAEKYWSLSGFPSHSLESGGGAFFTVIFGQIFAYFAFCDSHSSSPGSVSGFIASDRREVREIPHLCHRGHAAPCATVTDFDSIFRSELTEAASVTAIRALRMQKDQLQAGHTIPPSHSGRQASERPPCCHKESLAAYL
jgi:hypothetical protein